MPFKPCTLKLLLRFNALYVRAGLAGPCVGGGWDGERTLFTMAILIADECIGLCSNLRGNVCALR